MFGLGAFAGGMAQGLNSGMELALKRQHMENANKRQQFAQLDKIRNEGWQTLEFAYRNFKAKGMTDAQFWSQDWVRTYLSTLGNVTKGMGLPDDTAAHIAALSRPGADEILSRGQPGEQPPEEQQPDLPEAPATKGNRLTPDQPPSAVPVPGQTQVAPQPTAMPQGNVSSGPVSPQAIQLAMAGTNAVPAIGGQQPPPMQQVAQAGEKIQDRMAPQEGGVTIAPKGGVPRQQQTSAAPQHGTDAEFARLRQNYADAIELHPEMKQVLEAEWRQIVHNHLAQTKGGDWRPHVLGSGEVIFVNPKTREVVGQDGQPYDPASDNSEAGQIAAGIIDGTLPPTMPNIPRQVKAAAEANMRKHGFNLNKIMLEWRSAETQTSALARAQNAPRIKYYQGLAVSVVNTIEEVKNLSEQFNSLPIKQWLEKNGFGGVTEINATVLETLRTKFGETEAGQLAAAYLAAVNTLTSEFANLENGSYAPTEEVWKLANRQITANYGVKQLTRSLTEIQRLINFRVNAINEVLGVGQPNRYMPQREPTRGPVDMGDGVTIEELPSGQ